MPLEVSEDLLRAIVNKEKALSDGRTLAKKGAFKNLAQLDDKTLLWGQCQGSGAKPYEVSIDLIGDTPTIRCSCPVKPPPCKHTLGLLVAFLENAAQFKVADGPAELIEKRAKNVERAEKKAEAATKPKEVNKGALEKKTRAQRDGLDLLEKIVVDLAAAGLGTIDSKKAVRLSEQARQLNDAFLPGAAEALRRIGALAPGSRDDDRDQFWGLREPGDELPDELRHKLMLRHLVRLWAIIKRGRKALDQKMDEGESQSESDALIEDLLGNVWELAGLKAAGYWKQGLELFELADERFIDHVRQERIEQGFLVDLNDGAVYVERKFRPVAALDRVPEKASYEKPFTISEAGVYPGFANRRVRWELGAWKSRRVEARDFERIHAVALPTVQAAVAKLKEQLKNPLAADDAVLLLALADVQKASDGGLVAVDASGGTLPLSDSPIARYRSTNNLEMAAGAALDGGKLRTPASLLVRLYVGLGDELIHGQPLALVVGDQHIRLGM
jgi:SWIM zinc finger